MHWLPLQLHANIDPYSGKEQEHEVERLIQKGIPPYDVLTLREDALEDDRYMQKSKNTWLENGISDRAQSCWNAHIQSSADTFLKFLQDLPSEMEVEADAWAVGVTNLTGRVIRPDVLWEHGGSTTGVWRYVYV